MALGGHHAKSRANSRANSHAKSHAKSGKEGQERQKRGAAIAPLNFALVPFGAADGGAKPCQRLL